MMLNKIIKQSPFYTYLLAAIVLFVVINISSNILFSTTNIDLTKHKVYTLSSGTKNILASLTEPLKIRFFYSEKLATNIPAIQAYAQRIKRILKKYIVLSKGNISLDFINVEPFSVAEDQAVSFGVQAVPLNQNGDKLYLGLVISDSADEISAIPFFDLKRETFLEYDLTRAVYDLTNTNKTVIGIMSWLPQAQETNPYMQQRPTSWTILDQLKKQFTVHDLDKNITKVPANIEILVVIHPHDLSDETQYALDQYVLAGGKALIFVDPYLELSGVDKNASDLTKLLNVWGIILEKGKIVADGTNSLQVSSDGRSQSSSKLNWLAITENNINSEDLITSELNQLYLISAGSLVQVENTKLQVTPLLTSSENSMLSDLSLVADQRLLLKNFSATGERFTLAARVQGDAKSAFPHAQDTAHIKFSKQPINLIIVADVDMLRDRFWVQKQNFFGKEVLLAISDNASFVTNSLDKLRGNIDLISLRSRKKVTSPFEVVVRLRKEAEANFLREQESLQNKLIAAEKQLQQMQAKDNSGQLFLSVEQEHAINGFRAEIINTRQKLRRVQHSLNVDIDNLGTFLKIINILLIPCLIILLSIYIPRYLGIKKN